MLLLVTCLAADEDAVVPACEDEALFLTEGEVLTGEVRTPVFPGAGVAVLLFVPAVLTALPEDAVAFFDSTLPSEGVRSRRDVDEVPRPPLLVVLLAKTLSDPV